MGEIEGEGQHTEKQLHRKILTETKEQFARAYIENGGNPTAAYEAVLPNPDRLPMSTQVGGSAWVHDPEIAARIEQLRAESLKPLQINETFVLLRAIEIAMSSARDRIPALNIVAKYFPAFKEGVTVDARALNLQLPAGTTLEDLKALRDSLQPTLPEAATPSLQEPASAPETDVAVPDPTSEI